MQMAVPVMASEMGETEAAGAVTEETAQEQKEEKEVILEEEPTEAAEEVPAAAAQTEEAGASAEVSVTVWDGNDLSYTGSQIRPVLVVYEGSQYLKEGTDYSVSYENNVNAGTATAHVKGEGAHSFEEDITYEITPHVLTDSDVHTSMKGYEARYEAHTFGYNDIYLAIMSTFLEEGVDYTITNKEAFRNNESGAEVVITGIGNCTGTVTAKVPEWDPAEITISGNFVYGIAPEPDAVVKIGDTILTRGDKEGEGDYYLKITFTSERVVQVEVIGSYDGADVYEYKTFRVSPYELKENDITLDKTSYVYTGEDIRPVVTVSANGKELVQDTDYVLEYKNNVNRGTASVTIHGQGNYSGQVTKTFTIGDKEEENIAITRKDSTPIVYDGEEKTPEYVVKAGDTVLEKGRDFTLDYENNVNAGTVTAHFVGKGGYAFQKDFEFKILPKPITDCLITPVLDGYEDIYKTNRRENSITISDGQRSLQENADYTIESKEELNKNGGKVKIIGKGNYGSTALIDMPSYREMTVDVPARYVPGDDWIGKVSVTMGKGTAEEELLTRGEREGDGDYFVSYEEKENGAIEAQIIGSFEGKEILYHFSMTEDGKTITAADVSLGETEFTYTGSEIKPAVSVSLAGCTLTEGTDYTVTYDGNINAGTGSVIVSGAGSYNGSAEKKFTILPKKITPDITLSKAAFTYNAKAQRPVITVKDGTTTLKASDYKATLPKTSVNAGTYEITVSLKGNYEGTGSATYKINPKKITPDITLSKAAFTYNAKAQRPVVTVKDGTTTLKASDYKATLPKTSVNAGTYKITVTLKGNYRGTASVTYKIARKKITPMVTLSASAYTYTGKVRKPLVTVKNGKTVIPAASYTVTYPSGMINVGTYKVVVRMKGNYRGAKSASFRINPKGTSMTAITPVANKMEFIIKWVRQPVQTTGYQIQYSPDKNFKTGVRTVTIKDPNVTKTTLTAGIKADTYYYVRIRTYKRIGTVNYYSPWGGLKK